MEHSEITDVQGCWWFRRACLRTTPNNGVARSTWSETNLGENFNIFCITDCYLQSKKLEYK